MHNFISVIIDNYNYGRFIGKAIESVLQQTYKQYELIIVDDGSVDHSREVIAYYQQRYTDKIIPVYKKNGGQASAFNAGFAIAKGDIVAFLDSDDYWTEHKLARIVKAHQEYDIVQHNLMKNQEKFFSVLESGSIRQLLRKYGFYGKVMPTSALSFRRDLLKKVFPIPETPALRICADAYIISHALYLAEIGSLNECLGVYRVHGSNHFCGAGDDSERSSKIIAALNEKLISQDLQPVPQHNTQADALASAFNVQPERTYLIYGTGTVGLKIYDRIIKAGGQVCYFSDSNPQRWTTYINGRQVLPPDKLKQLRQHFDKIVIGSAYIEDILDSLNRRGFVPRADIVYPGMDLLEG